MRRPGALVAAVVPVVVAAGLTAPSAQAGIRSGTQPSSVPAASDNLPGGPAVVHDGYTSVFTFNSIDGSLQETYLPALGQPWATRQLSAAYNTGLPTAIVHPGTTGAMDVTSVYTVVFGGTLQETYQTAPGQSWVTQSLPAPQVGDPSSPAAVVHDGYTSVYTLNVDQTLQETYLPAFGQPWQTHTLPAPPVEYGITPAAVVHDGYTSVYTINYANSTLQETYLPALGQPWQTHTLPAPPVEYGTSPAAVVYDGYTFVFTINANGTLQETYLPALGQPWQTQTLPAPAVEESSNSAAAVVHDGILSVYTINYDGTLQETYWIAGAPSWVTQTLPAPAVAAFTGPAAVVHDGIVSVYTITTGGDYSLPLQETYLTAPGQPWATHALPTPPSGQI